MNNTIGERRVRTEFNPSQNDVVSQIKQKTAELINMIDALESSPNPSEVGRLKSLAMTSFEEGAMWAVKAATTKTYVTFVDEGESWMTDKTHVSAHLDVLKSCFPTYSEHSGVKVDNNSAEVTLTNIPERYVILNGRYWMPRKEWDFLTHLPLKDGNFTMGYLDGRVHHLDKGVGQYVFWCSWEKN